MHGQHGGQEEMEQEGAEEERRGQTGRGQGRMGDTGQGQMGMMGQGPTGMMGRMHRGRGRHGGMMGGMGMCPVCGRMMVSMCPMCGPMMGGMGTGAGGEEEGPYRGKGPARRTDEQIKAEVERMLTDDSWLDASNIQVSVQGGVVTLTGTVDSRDSKRRAEGLADGVSGVRDVQNNLQIQPGQ